MTTPAPAPKLKGALPEGEPPEEAPPVPEPEPEAPAGSEPTHDLLLSDGRLVPSYGAVPTHYAEGDRVWRVVHVTER